MINKFETLELLGKGAFGRVYKVKDKKTGLIYAMKRIEVENQEKRRVEREIKALTLLRHPHIVPLYESHYEGDYGYLIMEYIKGENLQQKIQQHKGGLPKKEYNNYLTQILAGMSYVHQKGMIHRDIKSSNILLDKHNKAYVTDFGTVKLLQHDESQLTATHAFIGTKAYASPEALLSKQDEITHLTDIYSIGIVLYEMLTGQFPFSLENEFILIAQIVKRKPVSPSKINKKISKKISNICLKALEKNPSKRFQSCQEFLDALNEVNESRINQELESSNYQILNNAKQALGYIFRRNKNTAHYLTDTQKSKKKVPYQDKTKKKNSTQENNFQQISSDDIIRFEKEIEKGNVNAMVELAKIYHYGKGVSKNTSKAIQLYQQGAVKGDHHAMLGLGNIYRSDPLCEKNGEKIIYWYKQAAEHGNDQAMLNLANMYEYGIITNQSYEDSLQNSIYWYEQAVNAGNTHAMYHLGLIYLEDKHNKEKGIILITQAAEHGNIEAKNYLENIKYKETINLQHNIKAPQTWKYNDNENNHSDILESLEQQAEQGCEGSMYRLATLYEHGNGVKQNYINAAVLYQEAASKGNIHAMLNLGILYREGKGVEVNNKKAIEYFEWAVEKGSIDAMVELGTMYEFGKGVQQNYISAIALYEEAAYKGNKNAMNCLKNIYEKGKDDIRDKLKANYWHNKYEETSRNE